MKLQLIGKMTGMEGWNYSAFDEAASRLREAGHVVFNPAETAGGDTTLPRSYYMRASIGGLLNAEGVVTLPGWETSPGAKTEIRVALALGLPVFSYEGFLSCMG
jgi:hypothetical protein